MDVAETPEEFAAACRSGCRTGVPPSQKEARRRLDREGWAAKSQQFADWLGG